MKKTAAMTARCLLAVVAAIAGCVAPPDTTVTPESPHTPALADSLADCAADSTGSVGFPGGIIIETEAPYPINQVSTHAPDIVERPLPRAVQAH